MMNCDAQIEGIAPVGERKRKDPVNAFTCRGLRSTQVEYFQPHQDPLAWEWVLSRRVPS